jgi:hypothetical protein
MKNSEIHQGLTNKEVRDFLSNAINKSFEEECNNKVVEYPYDKNEPFEWSIKNAEAQIEYLKKQINIMKARQAIILLIKSNGWQEFDVSDLTKKDTEYLHMNFIGTVEEHENLLKKIK